MRCFKNGHMFGGAGIAIPGHHNAFDLIAPKGFESRRHLRRAFSGADHNRAPLWPIRQMLAQYHFWISSSHRRIEQTDQESSVVGIDHAPNLKQPKNRAHHSTAERGIATVDQRQFEWPLSIGVVDHDPGRNEE